MSSGLAIKLCLSLASLVGLALVTDVACCAGEEQEALGARRIQILRVVFSPDGRTMAASGQSRNVWIWKADDGQLEHRFAADETVSFVSSLAYSPDGKMLASADCDGFLTSIVTVRNSTTGVVVHTLPDDSGIALSLAVSPDGEIGIGTNGFEFAREGVDALLWNPKTGEKKRLEGHAGSIQSVAFSPDGKTLACGSYREVKLWDVRRGALLKTFINGITFVNSVAFSPDGKSLFEAGGRVRMWDVQSGELLTTIKSREDPFISVAVSPDGKLLAIGTAGVHGLARIMLFALPDFDLKHTLYGERSERFRSLAFSPDGKSLAAARSNGTVTLWDPQTGKVKQALSIPE